MVTGSRCQESAGHLDGVGQSRGLRWHANMAEVDKWFAGVNVIRAVREHMPSATLRMLRHILQLSI